MNMSKRKRLLGAVDPLTLGVIVIIGLGAYLMSPSSVPGRKHKYEFWKKNPVTVVQNNQAALDAAKAEAAAKEAAAKAKIDAEKSKQLDVAHDGALGTQAAIEAAITTTNAGKLPVKELDTAKTLSDTTVDAMDEALGKKSLKRVQELELMVTNLNNGVAAGQKALELMQGALDNSVQREAALKAELVKLEALNAVKVANAEAARDAAVKKAEDWALERDAIARRFENLKFWGFVAAGGIALLWLSSIALPLLSKAFPALSALSNTVGGIWAPGVQLAKASASKLSEDLVAMHEWTKKTLEEKLTPEELAAYKKTIAEDWMTVHDGSAKAVEQIKAKLRL